jgi:hypothetical protein
LNKKQLSESDICDKFIRPAMVQAGWNGMDQIYREYPLRAGRVMVRGNKSYRAKDTVMRADYALNLRNDADRQAVMGEELEKQGLLIEALVDEVQDRVADVAPVAAAPVASSDATRAAADERAAAAQLSRRTASYVAAVEICTAWPRLARRASASLCASARSSADCSSITSA